MKKTKNNIFLIIVLTLSSLGIVVIYKFTREYLKLWPSEPIAQGNFPSTPRWTFYADNNIISSPVAKDNFAFVKTSTTLYALDIIETKIEWAVPSVTKRDLVTSPVVVGSLVIVVEDASTLAAYSTASGELFWKTAPLQIIESGSDPVQSIAFNSRYLYVARYDWDLTAYDLKTGEAIWHYDLPTRSFPYVAVNERYVFLAAGEDAVSILDAENGREIWNYEESGVFGPILLSGNILYVTDQMHASLISLDINSHQVDRIEELPVARYEFSCILEAKEYLFVAAQKLVMLSKEDRSIVWSTDNLGYLECPILFRDGIYIRNNRNDLYLFDQDAGQEIGKLEVRPNTLMKRDFFRSPIIVENLLVVPFGDNRLFVYQL